MHIWKYSVLNCTCTKCTRHIKVARIGGLVVAQNQMSHLIDTNVSKEVDFKWS